MTRYSAQAQLESGAEELSVPLSSKEVDQLCVYLRLLQKWNKTYNLTALKGESEIVALHLLDSITILPHLRGEKHIDVGTGAGLPGLVIAVCRPEWRMTLLDSNGKKTGFLSQAKLELGLKNVQVVHSRAEGYQPEQRFNGILSRAFASLKDMTDNAAHLLADDGRFWAMKGRYPHEEIEELDSMYKVEVCQPLRIPDTSTERHLVEISRFRENLD